MIPKPFFKFNENIFSKKFSSRSQIADIKKLVFVDMLLFDVLEYYHFYTGLKELFYAGGLYNALFQYFALPLMFDREIPDTAAATSPWTASLDWCSVMKHYHSVGLYSVTLAGHR